MILPRIYNKRLKNAIPLVMVCCLVVVSLNSYLKTNIDQFFLEYNGLYMNRQSGYDPRTLTHEVYLYLDTFGNPNSDFSNLGDDTGIYFHWDDWMDLSPGNRILEKYRKRSPDGGCDKFLKEFANVNGYFIESYDKKVLRGMANLYCLKDIPERVFVPTDRRMIKIPVKGKKRLGKSTDQAKVTKKQLIEDMEHIELGIDALKLNTTSFQHLKQMRYVDQSEFTFEPKEEIQSLKDKWSNETMDESDSEYLKFLEHSSSLVETSDTHFKYPWIITDIIQGRSHHFAYPFFKRFISDRERQSVVHHMVRAWFQFAEANNFTSWVNYGSLLGWAYNGVNLPWDTDVDIQMPIRQLDRLGRYFNKSIVIENPRYGNSKYYLEVAPTYVAQGNGKNFIDARFIDTNSGLYIDISALSYTKHQIPKKIQKKLPSDDKSLYVHCKNWNWHSLEEIFPVRHSYFEGGSVYIPNNVSSILARKYGKDSYTKKHHFLNHNFQKDINLWVPDRVCSSSPKIDRFEKGDSSRLTKRGACGNSYLQDEYRITKESSERHLILNEDIDSSVSYTVEELGDLPIVRKDAWDYYNDIIENEVKDDNWYTRQEIVQ